MEDLKKQLKDSNEKLVLEQKRGLTLAAVAKEETKRQYEAQLENSLAVQTMLTEKYLAMEAENVELYENLLDARGNIRVFCRVRPLQQGEGRTIVTESSRKGDISVRGPLPEIKVSDAMKLCTASAYGSE